MTHQVNFVGVPPVTLGWRLQMALDYAGLKQTDLMSKFEVSRQTVSRWCRDVGTPPKRFMLQEIASMCGVSEGWLIEGVSSDGGPPSPSYGLPSQLETVDSKRRKGSSHHTDQPTGESSDRLRAA